MQHAPERHDGRTTINTPLPWRPPVTAYWVTTVLAPSRHDLRSGVRRPRGAWCVEVARGHHNQLPCGAHR
eukprot:2409400-Prymnesium_polylepis.1